MKISAVFLTILILFLMLPRLVAADGEMVVISSTCENKFPAELIFKLEAEGQKPIEKVTLYYKVLGSRTSAHAYPEFTPGTRITATYSLKNNTQQTYLPPGTEIDYHWLLEDAESNELKSEVKSITFDDIRFQWHKLSQDNVTLYWYQGSQDSAEKLLEQAASEIHQHSLKLKMEYQSPIKIFAYYSKADMQPALHKRSEIFGHSTTTLGVRSSDEIMLLLATDPEVENTLSHELMHFVVHEATKGPFGDIPAWLDEGLAMNAEKEVPSKLLSVLDNAIEDDRLISVKSLSGYTGDPSQVNLYYAEVYSVVKFLLDSYGWDSMGELLQTFKEGSRYNDALIQVYSFDVDSLDAQWRASLGLKPHPTPKAKVAVTEERVVPTLVPYGAEKPEGGLPLPGTGTATLVPSTAGKPAAGSPDLPIVVAAVAIIVILGASFTLWSLRFRRQN